MPPPLHVRCTSAMDSKHNIKYASNKKLLQYNRLANQLASCEPGACDTTDQARGRKTRQGSPAGVSGGEEAGWEGRRREMGEVGRADDG
jgi:hypothetical protein